MPAQHSDSDRSPPANLSTIEPITMRIPDACRFTGISRSTLYVLIARGDIEIVKLGSTTLVLTESLRSLVETRRATGDRDNVRLERWA